MGTPGFALPSLDALADGGHELVAVATQPDRPRGRGRLAAAPPVKRRAIERGLRLLQPASPGEERFLAEVREAAPDLIAVVAYGNFLPQALWGLPPRGAINLHPSLLPRYRGAAPIPRAILAGERETGVTVLYLGEGMDAGDIIAQERVPIAPDDTGGTLAEILSLRGGASSRRRSDRSSGAHPSGRRRTNRRRRSRRNSPSPTASSTGGRLRRRSR